MKVEHNQKVSAPPKRRVVQTRVLLQNKLGGAGFMLLYISTPYLTPELNLGVGALPNMA